MHPFGVNCLFDQSSVSYGVLIQSGYITALLLSDDDVDEGVEPPSLVILAVVKRKTLLENNLIPRDRCLILCSESVSCTQSVISDLIVEGKQS